MFTSNAISTLSRIKNVMRVMLILDVQLVFLLIAPIIVPAVISDAMCEQRLWDMKHMGTQNFYLVEVEKDLTIDSTFKGNSSRFLNHSCNPNCKLEKWQLDGETRIGIFAARSIEAGEPLTYDYKYVLQIYSIWS
ncbi:hypothetical protein AgCh_008659 [Apium graveolens]